MAGSPLRRRRRRGFWRPGTSGPGDRKPAIRSGILEVWADSLRLRALGRCVVERWKSERPLEPAGFDSRFTGCASREYSGKDLNDYPAKGGVLPETAVFAARVWDPLKRLANNLVLFQDSGPEERADGSRAWIGSSVFSLKP